MEYVNILNEVKHINLLFQIRGWNNTYYFIATNQNINVLAIQTANATLRDITHDLRIDRITMPALRHTHASSLLYQKASIYYVSERLRHKNINTTLKEYTHVMKELREEDEQLSTSIIENMYVQSIFRTVINCC